MKRPGDDLAAVDPDEMGPAQLVMALAGRLRHARLTALEPFGLAPHQARAFLVIGRRSQAGEFRPSDLARHLGIAPRSATEVVDALQDKGLAERGRSSSDRRAQTLRLTEDGRDLLQRIRHGVDPDDAAVSAIFGALSAEELTELTLLLRKAAGRSDVGPS